MLSSLSYYFAAYSKAVAVNPMLAGFALYLTSVLTYLARNVPKKLWEGLKHSTTTSVEMNNAGWSGNEFHYTQFLMWFMKSKWSKWSRTLYTGRGQIRYRGDDSTVIGPGVGNHFFFLNGRLFWFHKEMKDSNGTDKQKEQITITTFGRKHKPLLDLIALFEYKEKENTTSVYEFVDKEWNRVASIQKRSLDTVFIPKEMKAQLVQRIDRFVNQPDWFRSKGLAYKMTNLLKGAPGTGKSTLVKALASHYNRTIHLLDLSTVSNQTLQLALATLPPRSVLLLEDVDAATNAVNSREESSKEGGISLADLAESRLTLAGLLNALDGIIPLEDVLVFLSTNHPEKLDPALVRKSRVDYIYEIGAMESPEIHEYAKIMYPDDTVNPDIIFDATIGCDIQAAFMESPNCIEGFLRQLSYELPFPNTINRAQVRA